jgi:hypothetical protein
MANPEYDNYSPKDPKAKNAAVRILEEIDKSFLLGAALDCMTDDDKLKFQKKLESVLGNIYV